MGHVQEPQIEVIPADPKKIRKIWMVTAILAAITCVEFIIAFVLTSDSMHTTKAVIFILLTILKAFYIVAEFMHLGHEKKSLVYSLIIPFTLFIGWGILAFLMEASFINWDVSHWY